jgi:glycosyltransferase involved in cell wall biosynthesis
VAANIKTPDQEKHNFEPTSAGRGMQLAGARVIFVLGPLELGGSERQALLFARYLKNEQQADVQVWGTIGAPGRLAALCEQYDIPWRIVPLPWAPGRFDRLRRLVAFARRLRGARPDIILPYMEVPNLFCGLVWRSTGARLCVWNQRDDGIARLSPRYESFAIRSTPEFIANSAQGAEHLVMTRGVASKRVRVVRNGIELAPPQTDRPEWRRQLQISEDWFVACMVANLTDYKDHVTLLRAWQIVHHHLKAEGRTSALLLAGRFDTRSEALKALAYDLGLDGSVRFLGQVNDVSGLLNASDAGVFCSNSEGSPNSVLEYMAAGLAVAGTDIQPMREALGTENHALLAPRGEAEALAAHILKLATDHELRARLGALNRRRAEAEFSSRRMCEETLDVIISGLRRRGMRKKAY